MAKFCLSTRQIRSIIYCMICRFDSSTFSIAILSGGWDKTVFYFPNPESKLSSCKIVLTFELCGCHPTQWPHTVRNPEEWSYKEKLLARTFPWSVYRYRVDLTFESPDKILEYAHSNESDWAEFFCDGSCACVTWFRTRRISFVNLWMVF